MYKNINDYEQIYLIRENDEDAKEVIFKKYKPIVLAIAKRYCDRTINGDIEDFVQEGYIGVNRAIASFDESYNVLFYTFCVICIERQIRSYYKTFSTKRNRFHTSFYSLDYDIEDGVFEDIIADTNMINPNSFIDELEYNDKLLRFKHSLNLKYSSVFELRYNGFKYKEIATLLDIPISSVDNYVHICKIRLKEFLKRSN